jgi:choline dehydrogenase
MSWDFFVRHYDNEVTQQRDSKFVQDRDGILYPRAGTLGGCTSHNAMITVYPHNSDWEGIRNLTGDDSWSAARMRDYFERLEACGYISGFKLLAEKISGLLHGQGSNPSRHGYKGWLHTSAASPSIVLKDVQLLKIVIDAAVRGLAHHLTDIPEDIKTFFDPNDWRTVTSQSREGVCLTPLATQKGCRNGTRERLLTTRDQVDGRLTIRTDALASRIIFEDGLRAVGVEYFSGPRLYRASRDPKDTEPAKETVYCRHEVIIAGGAFNSPQLLMLSGVGDEEHLRAFGIHPLINLPGVGRNLQDRYEVGIVSNLDSPFAVLRGATFSAPAANGQPDPLFAEWEQGRGVYTTNGAAIAVTKRSTPDKLDPDLFIFGLPSYFKGYYPGYSDALKRYEDVFTWAVLKAHTRNTAGRVRLRSDDPRDTPDIHFHYFAEGNDSSGDDLQSVVAGVKFAREMNDLIRNKVNIEEVWPGPNCRTDADIAQFIRDEAWGHHASCTNAIGLRSDPNAVLDSRFRVHGTRGLRVVDASVFPRIPGFFIVSAVYMAAEKASDVILEDLKLADRARAPVIGVAT